MDWLQIACAVALAMQRRLFPCACRARAPRSGGRRLHLPAAAGARGRLRRAGGRRRGRIGSYRTSKRWTSRIVSPCAIAALA
jgi:hypothetical protein